MDSRFKIQDFDLIKNTSRLYRNGTIWETNNCGNIEIIGRINKYRIIKGSPAYEYFLVKFQDGTLVQARQSNIKKVM